MTGVTAKLLATTAASLCLAGCLTEREHVLAPDTHGMVVDAATGQPVEGARVRFSGLEDVQPVITGPDGRFVLDGRTEKRTIIALPVGGVFRDSAQIEAARPDRATGYASAGFINGLGPAQAEYSVVVMVFPADGEEVALEALTRDCTQRPEQRHAMRLATYISSLDRGNPPGWLDAGTAEALREHLSATLPSSFFLACEQRHEAYDMYAGHTDALRTLQEAGPGQSRH